GSELWLSKDDDPANLKRFMQLNESRKGGFSMKEGQAYYVQAFLKEGGGDDYIRIGWKGPDGKEEKPIPGRFLADMNPKDQPDFRKEYQPFMARLHTLADGLGKIEEELKKLEDKDDKTDPNKRLPEQLKRFRNSMESYREFDDDVLVELQKRADETLHAAEIEEVDTAMDRLADMKRSDLVQFVLLENPYRLLDKLDNRGEVTVFDFNELAEPVEAEAYTNLVGELAATRIGSVINKVMNRYEKMPVAGLVVLSDGNNNAGMPTVEMKTALDERNIPIHALGVGAEEPPPDVAVARVVAPRTAFHDDNINVSVALHRHGHADKKITLKLMSEDEVLTEKEVEPGDEAEIVVDLSYTETNAGMRVYRVEAEAFK
ncbi:MAG: hypothetical protein AAF492_30245, partial [Verrucomicrobiota bacterium]